MNQQIKISLGVAVIIIITITAGAFIWMTQKKQLVEVPVEVVKIDQVITSDVSEQPTQQVVINDDWKTYRSDKLGFEIKIPKKANGGDVNVIENGNIAWILDSADPDYAEVNDQMQNAVSEFEKVTGVPWAILVKNVNNDQELDKFIKDRYGNGCKLGEKTLAPQPGLFDVKVDPINPDTEPGEGCFLNWILFVKYSPEKRLVAAWDMGQDVQFASPDKTNANGIGVTYDDDMEKSFKFTR